MNGHPIKCEYCDGHGIVQHHSRFDPCPEECGWCAGNGVQWLYGGGAIASYYSGPLVGRRPPLPTPAPIEGEPT